MVGLPHRCGAVTGRLDFENRPALPGPISGVKDNDLSLYSKIAGLALRRPRTIPYMLNNAWAFRARGWYRRPPFLPIPPRSYMRWRMETAYGDANAMPSDEELERYLRWTAQMRGQMTRRVSG